jgi:hypothetical protein
MKSYSADIPNEQVLRRRHRQLISILSIQLVLMVVVTGIVVADTLGLYLVQ